MWNTTIQSSVFAWISGTLLVAGLIVLMTTLGPGLALTTTSGTHFAITLDHPEIPDALLDTLRAPA